MTSKRERIESMLQEKPNEVFLHYSLAMEHLSESDGPANEEAAIQSLIRVRELDPAYVPVYLQLGMTHSRLEQEDEAREALQAGIPIAQQQGDAHAVSEMQAVLDSLPD